MRNTEGEIAKAEEGTVERQNLQNLLIQMKQKSVDLAAQGSAAGKGVFFKHESLVIMLSDLRFMLKELEAAVERCIAAQKKMHKEIDGLG